MAFSAFAIAALGFFVGLFFRVKALFPIVGLLLVAAVAFSAFSHLSFPEAALTILISQSILQGCYIVGFAARMVFTRPGGSPVF